MPTLKTERTLKKVLPILFIFFFAVACENTSEQYDELESIVSDYKEKEAARAIIAGVYQGDKTIYENAIGTSMDNEMATKDMHFRIGGVSETFLGTLLMKLVDENMIKLTDKVSQTMPELFKGDDVTVGMLIKNTAGYPDYVTQDSFVQFSDENPFYQFNNEEIIAYAVADSMLLFEPNTDSRYSHTEFTILGEVIQRTTGKSMKQLYDEHIFAPLDLQHTGYSTSPELPAPVLHAFNMNDGEYVDVTYWNPSWTGESGPLYSTLGDLRKWAPILGMGELLSDESFSQLIAAPFEALEGSNLYFASGFVVNNGWYFQNPNFNGYSGGFAYHPELDLTIIVYLTYAEDASESLKGYDLMKIIAKEVAPEYPFSI